MNCWVWVGEAASKEPSNVRHWVGPSCPVSEEHRIVLPSVGPSCAVSEEPRIVRPSVGPSWAVSEELSTWRPLVGPSWSRLRNYNIVRAWVEIRLFCNTTTIKASKITFLAEFIGNGQRLQKLPLIIYNIVKLFEPSEKNI